MAWLRSGDDPLSVRARPGPRGQRAGRARGSLIRFRLCSPPGQAGQGNGAQVPPHIAVWRLVRLHGDTKTEKSRRTLALPQSAVAALREHRKWQAEARLAAGPLWQDTGVVFTSSLGAPLDASHVRRDFRALCKKAGIEGVWAPRELRHTFVSVMSESGVAVEEIARLAGHPSSRTTETIYRHELRPVITTGAHVMDKIFIQA